MKVNAKEYALKEPCTLIDFLNFNNYDIKTLAVEINGVIIPKVNFTSTILSDNDVLEIVCFFGGG
ncbi:MAG: sulfur carrier protein ThiS [Erysipelotrichaceae bacterium]